MKCKDPRYRLPLSDLRDVALAQRIIASYKGPKQWEVDLGEEMVVKDIEFRPHYYCDHARSICWVR